MVLFGPPGAGKGTQAQLLVDRLKIAHISSGNLFRHHLQNGTPLGLKAADYMNRGVLVPDELTIDIALEKVMSLNAEEGFILDGFPRNTIQANSLDDALSLRSRRLDLVIAIDVPEGELIDRLGGRMVCRECQAPHRLESGQNPQSDEQRCDRCAGELYQRDDDTPSAVHNRIVVYQNETSPLLEFYRQKGLLAEVGGVDTVENVYNNVLAKIQRVSKTGDRE